MTDDVAGRVRAIRSKLDYSQSQFAAAIGASLATVQALESGRNSPSGVTLTKIAALGFSPTWILIGRGSMGLDDGGVAEAGQELGAPFERYAETVDVFRTATPSTDPELFGRVVDAIQRLYRDEHTHIPGVDLGRLAATKYDEIIAATADPDERMKMVKLIAVQLRNELRSRVAHPTTGKRLA